MSEVAEVAGTSIAANALFGGTETQTNDAPIENKTDETQVVLTPEQQAEADALKAAEAEAVIKRPGKDGTPEEWSAFYKSIGAPEKAEDYAVELTEGDAPETAALVQEMFKEANILPEQAAKLLEIRNRIAAETNAANKAAKDAADQAMDAKNKAEHDALTNEWGGAEPAKEQMEITLRGVTQFVPGTKDEQYKLISTMEKTLGYKQTMLFFHNIGKKISEADAAGLESNNSKTPEVRSAADRLYGGSAK